MTPNSPSSRLDPHWALYPRSYVAQRAPFSLFDQIDGDVDKAVWRNVPWSEEFGDIQGDDAPDNAYPPASTRFKALWDDEYLYIAALLVPSNDFGTQAHFTERNSPIYQKDSDFEVFLDPFGCNHNYKELELNAINTVWNLVLDKPYRDNGSEHSGRVAKPGEPNYWDVVRQKTATKVVSGTLNTDKGATWSVELALAHSDTLNRYPIAALFPTVGTLWRINFSRVELQGAVNWTWQKQVIWDPQLRRFAGKIDMHLPDAWGYLVFGGNGDDDGNETDPSLVRQDMDWPARLAAMNVYYAMHDFREKSGSYTDNIAALSVDEAIVAPFAIEIQLRGGGFLVAVKSLSNDRVLTVTDDRLLQVQGADKMESE